MEYRRFTAEEVEGKTEAQHTKMKQNATRINRLKKLKGKPAVIELDDLSSISKGEIEALKSFIVGANDKPRLPYSKKDNGDS